MSSAASITAPVNVLDYLRLAYKIARSYRVQGIITGLEMDDLRQLAVIGLMRAAKRFDPNRGRQFSTYAAKAMRRVIQDYIHKQEIQRVPDQVEDDSGNKRDWCSQLPARPESGLPPWEIRELHELLGCLTQRQREAVGLRFGLGGTGERSLDDIGRQLGCSPQRASQVLSEPMNSLRAAAASRAARSTWMRSWQPAITASAAALKAHQATVPRRLCPDDGRCQSSNECLSLLRVETSAPCNTIPRSS